MNLAEVIYQHVQLLPPSAAQEVLDFVDFLAERPAPPDAASLIANNPRTKQQALRDWLKTLPAAPVLPPSAYEREDWY